MSRQSKTIGRARIALTSGGEGNRQGLLSTVTARARDREEGCPVVFQGPVKFAEATVAHLTGVILPIVDRIGAALNVTPKTFELSVVNLGAAACHDLGIEVSGLSADLPVTLALLSAALEMPVRDDFVATGHVASAQGDIVAVKGIAAKLAAAIADRTIQRFLYGDLKSDRSLDLLSPREKDAAVTAIVRACNAIRAKPVSGIDELLAEAFTEHSIVVSSLRTGFFHTPRARDTPGDPVRRAIDFLGGGNDLRFWQLLQQDFSTDECDRALHLLETFAASFNDRGQYPSRFGGRLLRLLCALPPAIRRLKLEYPLLDFGRCVDLVRLAGRDDLEDVPILFDAVRGIVPGDDRWVNEPPPRAAATVTDCDLFDVVTAEIREPTLVRKFDLLIDSARASFVLASSRVSSYDEFCRTIESFFTHLQSYVSPEATGKADLEQARNEAEQLLTRAFWNHGGASGAFARASTGTEGGIRSVLDDMTDRYRAERRAAYIEAFLQRAVEGLDRSEKLRFARGALERLGPVLPEELKKEPPERFANQIGEIASAYAKFTTGMERVLKAM